MVTRIKVYSVSRLILDITSNMLHSSLLAYKLSLLLLDDSYLYSLACFIVKINNSYNITKICDVFVPQHNIPIYKTRS